MSVTREEIACDDSHNIKLIPMHNEIEEKTRFPVVTPVGEKTNVMEESK